MKIKTRVLTDELNIYYFIYRDPSMAPLSLGMSTVAAAQEIGNTTDMELNLNTSKSSVEETDDKMALTQTTMHEQSAANPSPASLEVLMDLTTTTSSLSITQKDISNSIPVVAKMADLIDVATTSSFVINNNDQATESAITSAITQAASTDATSLATSATTSAPALDAISSVAEHSTTNTMAIANEIVQDKTMNPVNPVTEFDFSSIFGSMTQLPGNDLFGGNNLPPADAMPNKVNENPIAPPHDEVDNVLTLPSNEDTTRIASSTDSKVDIDKKEVEPLASKTEPQPKLEDNGNSASNTISASFVLLLSVAVFYVII